MQQIDLLHQSMQVKSPDENQSYLLNMYLEENGEGAKYKVSAYPTPGYTQWYQLPSAPLFLIQGLYQKNGLLYLVWLQQVSSISSTGVKIDIGGLTGWSGYGSQSNLLPVKIASIQNEIMFLDQGPINTSYVGYTNGYFYNISANTFTSISSNFPSNPPNGATCLCAQDEFFLVNQGLTNVFQQSTVSDASSWPALNFDSATGNSNNIINIISSHKQPYIMCADTIEIWYNAGTSPITFNPYNGLMIEYGCESRDAIVQADNTIFFLGHNKGGGYGIYRIQDYSPSKISNRGIDYQLSTFSTVSDSWAWTFQKEGHEFIVFTFPTGNATFVYDITTQQWFNMDSNVGGVHQYNRIRYHSFCYGKNIVADATYNLSTSSTLYYLDNTSWTDAGTAIKRQIVTHPFYNADAQTYVDRLQIDVDNSIVGETVTVEVFKDINVSTLSNPITYTLTVPSDGRVYIPRLGRARVWVFRITYTGIKKFCVLGAVANTRIGEH